ncbi:O-antigen translocase [Lelliottia sp. JS-SCA-14]|uniref:O-antigen translocase n=1 Tax=Lelliottia sp. JS-SCA-14 TaxID=3110110 RepID=UPI002D77AA1D|nr:O-antigen translocase [Lelliottia sp. JS-SCA-14]
MRKLLSVTFFTGLLTLSRMIAGFIVAKVVAIYTGPTGIAMLGQLQNLINSITGLINSPVNTSVVKFTAEKHLEGYEACSSWWRVSIRWTIILYSIIAPILLLFSSFVSHFLFETETYSWIIVASAFSLPFTAIGTFINSVLNGQKLYKQYVILGMISVVLSSIVMLSLVVKYGIQGALIAVTIQNALIGLGMLLFAIHKPWCRLKYLFGSIDKENSKIVLGYVLMAVVSAVTMPTALIIIRKLLISEVGWEITGYWQAVWKISETYLTVITMSLSIYYLPLLSTIKSAEGLKKEIKSTAYIVMPAVALMALIIYLFRDMALSILFTESFRNARELFSIQLCGDVVKILSWLYAYALISRGATRLFVLCEITAAVTFVTMSYFCIKEFGAQGANIAYLLNYIVYFILVYICLQKGIKENS